MNFYYIILENYSGFVKIETCSITNFGRMLHLNLKKKNIKMAVLQRIPSSITTMGRPDNRFFKAVLESEKFEKIFFSILLQLITGQLIWPIVL